MSRLFPGEPPVAKGSRSNQASQPASPGTLGFQGSPYLCSQSRLAAGTRFTFPLPALQVSLLPPPLNRFSHSPLLSPTVRRPDGRLGERGQGGDYGRGSLFPPPTRLNKRSRPGKRNYLPEAGRRIASSTRLPRSSLRAASLHRSLRHRRASFPTQLLHDRAGAPDSNDRASALSSPPGSSE